MGPREGGWILYAYSWIWMKTEYNIHSEKNSIWKSFRVRVNSEPELSPSEPNMIPTTAGKLSGGRKSAKFQPDSLVPEMAVFCIISDHGLFQRWPAPCRLPATNQCNSPGGCLSFFPRFLSQSGINQGIALGYPRVISHVRKIASSTSFVFSASASLTFIVPRTFQRMLILLTLDDFVFFALRLY